MAPMSTRRFDDPNTQVVADILNVIEQGLPGLPPGPVADSLSKLAPMLEAAIERRTLEQAKEELEEELERRRPHDQEAADVIAERQRETSSASAAAAACRDWLRTDAPSDRAGR
jgi:hypothetical protein